MAHRPLTIMATLAALSLAACAQLEPDDHAAHHPEGATAPTASVTAVSAQAVAGTGQAGPMGAMSQTVRMDQHMKSMREMHEKMARASTPQEREVLMAEHMKLMQEGMAMMGGMGSGAGMGMMGSTPAPANPAARMQMMEKRMDMMQSMMQMMMDRMPAPATKP